MTYTNPQDNRETYPEARDIVGTRRGVLEAALGVLDWVVPYVPDTPVPETAAPAENVGSSVPFIPAEPTPESPLIKESAAEPMSDESIEASDAIEAARARALELALSAQEGLDNVSKVNQ